MFLPLGRLALPLGLLLGVLLLLLSRLFGFAAVFTDASVFTLSAGRHRPRNTQNDQKQEHRNSFHNVTGRGNPLSDVNTEVMSGGRVMS